MTPPTDPTTDRNLVPAATIARLFEVTVRRLGQLADEGAIPKAERGKYPLGPTIQGYVRFLKQSAARKSETMKEKQEAKLDKELRKLDIEIGEMEAGLIPVEEMTRRLAPTVTAMRQRILAAGLQPGDRDALMRDLGDLLEAGLTASESGKRP